MTYSKEDRQDDMTQEQIEDAIDEAKYKYGDLTSDQEDLVLSREND